MIFTTPLHESNDCHEPGGQSTGGQFCSTGGGVNTPAFKTWFRGSKVTKPDGSPLRVYHGTTLDFDAFDPDANLRSGEQDDSGIGIFFAEFPSEAAQFTKQADSFMGASEDAPYARRAQIIPVYLAIKKPKVFLTQQEYLEAVRQDAPYGHGEYKGENYRKLLTQQGFDGIIVKDSQFGYDYGRASGGRWFIAFHAKQVKSAIGNSGNFRRGSKKFAEAYGLLRESNDCHLPNGSGGGQFCSKGHGYLTGEWKRARTFSTDLEVETGTLTTSSYHLRASPFGDDAKIVIGTAPDEWHLNRSGLLSVARHEVGHAAQRARAQLGEPRPAEARIAGFRFSSEYVKEFMAWRDAISASGGRIQWSTVRKSLEGYLEGDYWFNLLRTDRSRMLDKHIALLKRYARLAKAARRKHERG